MLFSRSLSQPLYGDQNPGCGECQRPPPRRFAGRRGRRIVSPLRLVNKTVRRQGWGFVRRRRG